MDAETDSGSRMVRSSSIAFSATGTSNHVGGSLDHNDHQLPKTRRSMMRRQESTKSTSNGFNSNNNNNNNNNNDKGKLEKTKSRRMGQVNQDIKIIEITRQARTNDKKKMPNTSEIFKFECEGDIITPLQGLKKHVKWHATFDKPIEQLIYPSLQRFDNESYQEKRKVFRQLHGGAMEGSAIKSNVPLTVPSPAHPPLPQKSPKSSKQQQQQQPQPQQQQQMTYSFSENHGIKIDILPEAMAVSSDFMFIHTPKWTVDVTDVKPISPKVPLSANIEDDEENQEENNGALTSRSHRKIRANLIRKQINKEKKRRKKAKRQKKSSLDRMRVLTRDEDGNDNDSYASSYDDDDDFDDDDDDADNYSRGGGGGGGRSSKSSSLISKTTLLEEIETEGEKYLRRQIKDHYELKKEEDKLLQLEKHETMSPFHELKLSLQRKKDKLPPLVHNPADNLYAQLVNRHNLSKYGTSSSTSDHAMTPVSKLHKLSDLTSEEVAFNEQSKALKKIIPQESDYLMDGVLYYRIQNQLHNSQLQQLQAIEQRKMVVQPKKLSRRYSNYFSQRLSSRKSSEMNQTISEIHLSRNEDPHLVKSTDIQYLDDIHEMHFHRFNRAVENKFHGFTELENEKDLQYLTNTSNRIEQQRPQNRFNNSSAFARPMSASTPKGNEKPNVMSKFAGQRGSTTNQASLDNAQRETEALMSAERSKRKAQDLLLLNQLEAGVLPETFIKASEDPRFITINLSQYGIGDVRGLCLGKCLKALDRLQSIGLTDNRLTSLSLPTIINNLNYATVMDLDLSFNQVHDQGAKALANHFKYTNNVLRFLDISNCSIKSSDIKILCDILKIYPNQLEEFYLSGNNITEDGAIDLCAYLSSRTCNLNILDLSWNHIGELGAIEFSHAMKINKSLIKLNLASNSLNDKGGQRFIDSLADQNTLVEVNIAQNGISNGTCFVVSQVLKGHPSLRRLDLSLNPLGEAGARSIFRTILRGLSCFVIMRNSSYPENNNIFNHTYPMMDNPYHLDLSEPYKHAVVQELIMKYLNDPQHCYFENMTYKESIKSSEQSIHLSINSNGIVVNKATQEKWKVPKHGILKFHFHQEIFVPTIDHRIPDKDFQMLQIIIENGVTEIDKRTWLSLLCQDIYLTTNQAQEMIDRFKKNRTIGTGGLSVLDVLTSIWKVLLDTENMFDFLYANTDKNERRDLVYAITLKQYKFNWANPTSHWSLNLADKVQRAIMMQIIAINNSEAEFSQKHSGRGDTSQQGNWFNFRNVKYTLNRVTNDILIDKEFLINLPVNGTLDFDYVSTKRPPAELYQNNRKYKKGSKKIGSMDVNNMSIDTSEDEDMGPSRIMSAKANRDILTSPSTPANGLDPSFGGEHGGEDEYIIEDNLDFTSALKRPKSSSPMNSLIPLSVKSSRPVSSHTPKSQSGSEPNSSRIPFQSSNSNVPRKIKLITDDELYIFMQQLGLSNRSKISGSQTLFVLMDLQLASTKYFFTVANVLIILDAFEDDWEIQSRVIVALFSRIKDLHNIDILLRNLNMKGQQDIIKKLGYLNVINPLKISFDYVLSLKYLDNRILLIALMELAAIESADQISEEPNTELAIATLYGSYTRALNDVRPEVMRFSYADFGIRTTSISWATRREYIKKFLVGTQPLDEEIYQTISMYKELESHGALTRGPIDLQYATYLKQQKSTQARTVKMTKNMQNAMRNATKEAKK